MRLFALIVLIIFHFVIQLLCYIFLNTNAMWFFGFVFVFNALHLIFEDHVEYVGAKKIFEDNEL